MSDSPNSHHVPLASQVGGHPGLMITEDGSLLIKPALPVEVQFYQSVMTDPNCEPIQPYIPRFMGTLRLEGELDPAKSEDGTIALKQDSAEAVEESHSDECNSRLLENLSHPFHKPNILDIKLGTVLYDESASEEKRARMIKTAQETTSFETGVRLTGFQVYDLTSGDAINTPKSYGKSIKSSDLPEGFTRFFVHSSEGSHLPSERAKPRTEGKIESETFHGTGLPSDLLLPILQALHEDVAEIREALLHMHIRMVGASLLIIYEADWERCREGVQKFLVDGEYEEEEEGEEEENKDDENDKPAGKPGPPYIVKLIDFAHTRIVPGQGPDAGVLTGLDTVLKLLDGRIQEIEVLVSGESTSEKV